MSVEERIAKVLRGSEFGEFTWPEEVARAVLAELNLTEIGWCPRAEGHACMPEPLGDGSIEPDDGSCGSKWTHHAYMTRWTPFDPIAGEER